jgi:hypothetical protein
LVLCALLWFSIPSSKTRDTFTSIFNATVFIVLACTAILALAGLLGLPPLKPKQPRDAVYAVSIRFRLFSSIVAASTDRAYIEKIAGAIQYAMARRDNDKVGATAPESMGQGLEVPTPTVRGNTLYAGDAVYELSEARACKLSWITDRRWPSSVLLGALILQQLLNYAGRYSPDLLSWAFAGEMFIVVPVMCAYLIAGMPSSSNRVYVVRVSPIAGGEHSVFASTSKGDAMEMQRSIEQAMKGSYAVGNA